MKAFKGFNKDLTCRGFQYKVGETYEEEKAELCHTGFHGAATAGEYGAATAGNHGAATAGEYGAATSRGRFCHRYS